MKVILFLFLTVVVFTDQAKAISFVLQQNTTSELCYFYSPVIRSELNEVLKNYGFSSLGYTQDTKMIGKNCVMSLTSIAADFDFVLVRLGVRQGADRRSLCKADVARLIDREGTFWAGSNQQSKNCVAMSAQVIKK